METTNLIPAYATHVGSLLKEELAERGMKQIELAKLTGIPAPLLNDIIKEKRNLSAENALLIGKAMEIPADFLMRIQSQYELDVVRIQKRTEERLKNIEIWNILKEYIPTAFFKKVGIIKDDIADTISSVFTMFNVNTIDEVLSAYAQNLSVLACYKKSMALETNEKYAFSWKKYCLYAASLDSVNYPAFSPEQKDSLITELKKILCKNKSVIDATTQTLQKYGIRLLIIEHCEKVPADGMAFFQNETPTIVLTLRKKNIDNFAFTLLHEICHIIKHLKPGDEAVIDFDEMESTERENEANDFAANAFIPKHAWNKFLTNVRGCSLIALKRQIDLLSEEYAIHPQIIFGRYTFATGNYRIKPMYDRHIG